MKGLSQLQNPMTSSEIETATFWHVAYNKFNYNAALPTITPELLSYAVMFLLMFFNL
jgi:hypothetical protein